MNKEKSFIFAISVIILLLFSIFIYSKGFKHLFSDTQTIDLFEIEKLAHENNYSNDMFNLKSFPSSPSSYQPHYFINVSNNWEITLEEKISDTEIFVYGNITINGGSLELSNVTLSFMGNQSKSINVLSNGKLIINSTIIKPHENYSESRWVISSKNSVVGIYNSNFQSMGISRVITEEQGIYLFRSEGDISNLTINNAYTAFTLEQNYDFMINASRLTSLDRVITAFDSSNITIGGNLNVSQLEIVGIQFENVSYAILENIQLPNPNTGNIGVLIQNSRYIKITKNTFYSGIQSINCNHLEIVGNHIIDPNAGQERNDYGILFQSVSDSVIGWNIISGLEIGVTAVGGHSYGVSLQNGENISLRNNKIQSFRGWGVEIQETIDISVKGNQILQGLTPVYYDNTFRGTGGGIALYLSASTGVEIINNNTFIGLPLGLYIDNRSGKELDFGNTQIFLNNWENEENYYSENLLTTIFWYSSSLKAGNYWNTYTGIDANSDFIIDQPFFLTPQITDYYPLKYPNYVPDINYNTSHTWFLANGVNQKINWLINDEDAFSYSIYQNGSMIESGLLNDTRIINTTISPIEGVYEYNCTIIDIWLNVKTKIVIITVEPPDFSAPILSVPDNITLNEFEPKKKFIWNCVEAHPTSYTITLNGIFNPEELTKDEWNTSHLAFELGNLKEPIGPPLYYNLTLVLIDILENKSIYKDIPVFVIDTGPVIIGQLEIIGSQDSLVDIFWDVYDAELLLSFYQVFRNNSLQPTASSTIVGFYTKIGYAGIVGYRIRHRFNTSSSEITLSTYNITIQVNDSDPITPHTNTSTTMVYIRDRIPPFVSPDIDNPTVLDEFAGFITFSWNCSDTNPLSYNMSIFSYENESTILIHADHDSDQNNTWNGEDLIYNLNAMRFRIGNYRFYVSVTDLGNNTSVSPGGIFTIIDNTTIQGPFDPPENLTLEYENIEGVKVQWNFSDRNPDLYRIFRNRTLIESNEWNGSIIEINITDFLWAANSDLKLRLNYYELTIIVSDKGNHLANHTLGITVQDTIAPLIINPPSDPTFVFHNSINDHFNFTITEGLPNVYYLIINDQLIEKKVYNESIVIYYSIFTIGTSKVNLTLTDLAKNIQTYILNLTLNDLLSPILLNTQDNRTLEYPNVRLSLSWNVYDIRPSYYLLYVNNLLIINESWIDRIYILIDFKIGKNNVALFIFDTSKNFVLDEFIISILDKNAPIIHYVDPSSYLIILEGESADIYILADDEDPSVFFVYIDNEEYFDGIWQSEIEVHLNKEVLQLGIHNVTITIFDGSGNFINESIQIKVIQTSTITVPPVNRIFGMDQTSFRVLVGISVVIVLIFGVRRYKQIIRKKK